MGFTVTAQFKAHIMRTVEQELMLNVEGEEKKQDAGAILQGSANVINAIGGIYGTYIAAKTGNSFIPTGEMDRGSDVPAEDDEMERKRKRNTWIIAGVGLVAVAGILFFTLRENK